MKLLLSCVNSTYSLLGFDWTSGQVFWRLPASVLKSCGICYAPAGLLVASDDSITRLSNHGVMRRSFDGPHPALAHSVHPIRDGVYGIVDTGNSLIRVVGPDLQEIGQLSPLASWPQLPEDAVHLNDFAVTPAGILASCFDYRPWRAVRGEMGWNEWCTGGYGLVLNVTSGAGSRGAGRVVGCGYNHPHSLQYRHPYVSLCSSATGEFHQCEFDPFGNLHERRRCLISKQRFLRGVLGVREGWFMGGSAYRHGQKLCDTMAVYFLRRSAMHADEKILPVDGEIYEILPWNESVMTSVVRLLASNPRTQRLSPMIEQPR